MFRKKENSTAKPMIKRRETEMSKHDSLQVEVPQFASFLWPNVVVALFDWLINL
jgi:hypothetical protein